MLVQDSLIKYHKSYYRDFIWRHNIEPYKILIAEFMLHRTRAEQVEPVYRKFLEKYPDIISLSNASYQEITFVTENLGLHWRSKHFLDAAIYISSEFNGKIPDTREQLLKIPGVGDYVAGAILTVCFRKREYVIDSNIARFINRYYNLGLAGEIRRLKIIKDFAIELFNYKNTRRFLFTLLDFCALRCKPIKPLCDQCPIHAECLFEIYKNSEVDTELYVAEKGNEPVIGDGNSH